MARLNHNGYVEIYNPKHHRARGNGYVFEHIIVAEEKLGRRLKPNEHVHHLNKNKKDNRPENLEVVDIVEHTRLHAKERRKGKYISCEQCGKTFYRKPSHIKKAKYCSLKCVGLSSKIAEVNNKKITKEQIEKALKNNEGNKKKAALELGVHYSTVYKYIKKLGVKKYA
ncbi:HNH endonuclease signature motif containing protein [Ornithinibacillus xuwenensis]|uniref:HNH endonuclease n=1 Tax=Ornithinibacillus xuwenensis TaxID=3144668 RepID=A0ABU9XBV5_9BACI